MQLRDLVVDEVWCAEPGVTRSGAGRSGRPSASDLSPGMGVCLLAVTRAECAPGSGRGGKLGFSAEHRPGVFTRTMCIQEKDHPYPRGW